MKQLDVDVSSSAHLMILKNMLPFSLSYIRTMVHFHVLELNVGGPQGSSMRTKNLLTPAKH